MQLSKHLRRYSSSLEPSDDLYPVMHMHMRAASEPPATRMGPHAALIYFLSPSNTMTKTTKQ